MKAKWQSTQGRIDSAEFSKGEWRKVLKQLRQQVQNLKKVEKEWKSERSQKIGKEDPIYI